MYRKFIKRILDLLISLFILPFFILILILFSLIIYIDDKGPIFYNSSRLGKNGKVFKMYKLRSMKVHAPDIRNKDGSTYNSKDDPRLTKIGKFIRKTSIDEIPQVLNIIIGNMSFVGPRPDLPEHKNLYDGNENRKLEIKPGVTGYNQAYYRNTIEWKKRIKNDIYYIDNISFIFDVKIVLKTIKVILLRKNVYIDKEE
ncbi:MAG: sugar transferase [Tenericutes bacterium]|nr:sugar transferase [Mycoplasmatota bacterium]